MIRRDLPDQFLLITQHDHALLAADLARHVGNALFSPPSPYDPVVWAIAQHDCGWPLHDNHPTVNAKGQPRHVFESTCDIVMRVWPTCVERVVAKDAYAGLLVSLHTMALATHAAAHQGEDDSESSRQELFRYNRFLHKQIEVQESLRLALGMRIDLPLRRGLANLGRSSDEDLLLANFHLLEFLDQLSLILCFDRMVFDKVRPILPRPGAPATEIRLQREAENLVRLDPWPFDAERLDLKIQTRRIPAMTYRTDAELEEACSAAPEEPLTLSLRAWHMAS